MSIAVHKGSRSSGRPHSAPSATIDLIGNKPLRLVEGGRARIEYQGKILGYTEHNRLRTIFEGQQLPRTERIGWKAVAEGENKVSVVLDLKSFMDVATYDQQEKLYLQVRDYPRLAECFSPEVRRANRISAKDIRPEGHA